MFDLLAKCRLGSAKHRADLADAHAHRLGDLCVAEPAVTQDEHGGASSRQPPESLPNLPPRRVVERELLRTDGSESTAGAEMAKVTPALPAARR